MLSLFNIANNSKSFKRANKLAIDGIKTKIILFLPMVARKLTLEESASYEELSEERLEEIRASPE